jgi:hypothetical protein
MFDICRSKCKIRLKLKTLKELKYAHIKYILACHLKADADPDTAYHFDADPQQCGIAKHDLGCMQFAVPASKVNKRITDYLLRQLQMLFDAFQLITVAKDYGAPHANSVKLGRKCMRCFITLC